ncbi:cadmium-exporting ATPase [Lactobacillus selangorensis]|uniref:Cd(2+)-exporting ATPase n=1 Tax=Lactobacillus selangorensis TaxID=81857 RepID=A0A0R2FJU8_9LACO|nr:heavy metal translocating P-type ATPase [Lactobacillus selangorensis]KRN28872.1 cadmium-exporting ATPase [Lactobacillus selangorensis]KRN32718.1 cadmium-exporting ATPase [Lactobacillus selangorensis]
MAFEQWIQQKIKPITAIAAALVALGLASHWLGQTFLQQGFYIIAAIIAGVPILLRAWSALRMKIISIELLVSVAVIGAFIIGEYDEAAFVTFLFLFGDFLEQKTLAKTRQSIQTLADMAPTTALVVQPDGQTAEIDVDDVVPNQELLVKTGAQIPVDGEILTGRGDLNEASITGESRLVAKENGADVYAGTILENGTLHIKATKVGDDTTFAKIVELVEDAQDTKSHAEKLIDKFAQYYTPAVLVIALLVGLVTQNLRLAITVLVLGCPGALVIGAPVSNVAGIGNGAKHGVLVKGGAVMTTLRNVDTFVFDKTGTLTQGKTTVTTIHQDDPTGLQYAARLENDSDHPLGRAIVAYAADHQLLNPGLKVTATQTYQGLGIAAQVDGQQVLVGNQALLKQYQVTMTPQQTATMQTMQTQGESLVLVAVNGQLTTLLGISDQIRPAVAERLQELKQLGAKQLVMLTGDNERTAQAVAAQIGIDQVHAELLPADKVKFVKQLQSEGRTVAFVGDGINDSPSLAQADIGIAMGSGTDVALETSDVVLMQSDFTELVHAYGLARKTVGNMRENIVIALATVAFLFLGLIVGVVDMASGMLVHEGSILVVILNAMRLIGYQRPVKKIKENWQIAKEN